ncbi:hypothetical protein ACH492_22065 [Streptomyces sp. NPDC019443]|uniref:hypothetical protein n=1 Tax=Streptomyces sp. NPDC019443 TaxID=3365061 RepID=UPI0037881431
MSPTPADRGPVRPAADVNAEIRALFPPGAVEPTDPERYQRLLVEWAEAVRAEQQLAA